MSGRSAHTSEGPVVVSLMNSEYHRVAGVWRYVLSAHLSQDELAELARYCVPPQVAPTPPSSTPPRQIVAVTPLSSARPAQMEWADLEEETLQEAVADHLSVGHQEEWLPEEAYYEFLEELTYGSSWREV